MPRNGKNGQQMAEQVDTPVHTACSTCWGEQYGHDVPRRDYVVEHLMMEQELAVDETSFLKRGEESVGVETLWSDGAEARTAVKLECFSFISSKGQSLIDRRLTYRSPGPQLANDVRKPTFPAR